MRRHMFRWSPARIIAGAFGSISFIGSIYIAVSSLGAYARTKYNLCRCFVYCG